MGPYLQPSTSQTYSIGDIENAATHVEGAEATKNKYMGISADISSVFCDLFCTREDSWGPYDHELGANREMNQSLITLLSMPGHLNLRCWDADLAALFLE